MPIKSRRISAVHAAKLRDSTNHEVVNVPDFFSKLKFDELQAFMQQEGVQMATVMGYEEEVPTGVSDCMSTSKKYSMMNLPVR